MNISSGKIVKAKKVVVYGPEGVGKTTFAASFPNPLFSDTENSTVNYNVRRFDKPTSWTMLWQQAKYVKEHPDICDTYVVDTADWAERLCSEHICAKAGVSGIEDYNWGKGYTYLEEEFGRFLNLLEDIWELGINVVVTAHAEVKKIDQPEEIGGYDHWQMKLEKKTMPLLKEWCDLLIFANYKVYVVNIDNQGAVKGKNKVQGGNRVMYTTHTPWWDAKNRDNLPEEMPFDYSGIAHIIPTSHPAKAEPTNQRRAENKPATTPLPVQPAEPPIEKEAATFYWYNPQNDELFTTVNSSMEEVDNLMKKGSQLLRQDEYEALQKVDQRVLKQDSEFDKLPTPLKDLMKVNKVVLEEIQEVVSSKGYYPKDTPVANYDPDFIDGVLIAAWDQVFQMIEDMRFKKNNNIPF